MRKSLVDAGPLIAIFDRDDFYHEPIKNFLKSYEGLLFTTCPVITEVLYMLNFNPKTQLDFLQWVERGAINIVDLNQEYLTRAIELSLKYTDIPMDFADSSLIILSEKMKITEIISIDTDFFVYRNIRNQYLKNIFQPG